MLPADVGLISSGVQVLDIESADNSYMSMPDSLWGAYNREKFAFELILRNESLQSGNRTFYHKGDSTTNEFTISFVNQDSDGRLNFSVRGSTTAAQLVTTAAYTSLTDYYHFLIHFDLNNATANDRMKIIVNGTQVTLFDIRTNPTQAAKTTTTDMTLGGDGFSNDIDALILRAAFFSNSLPAFSDLVDTTTRVPKNILGVTGIYSLCSPLDGITYDRVRGQSWTNNGGVTIKAVAPVRIPT